MWCSVFLFVFLYFFTSLLVLFLVFPWSSMLVARYYLSGPIMTKRRPGRHRVTRRHRLPSSLNANDATLGACVIDVIRNVHILLMPHSSLLKDLSFAYVIELLQSWDKRCCDRSGHVTITGMVAMFNYIGHFQLLREHRRWSLVDLCVSEQTFILWGQFLPQLRGTGHVIALSCGWILDGDVKHKVKATPEALRSHLPRISKIYRVVDKEEEQKS